jgi:hypothetical protein
VKLYLMLLLCQLITFSLVAMNSRDVEEGITTQQLSLQYSLVSNQISNQTTSLKESAQRWAKSYLLPGVLMGGGAVATGLTYWYSGNVEDTRVIIGYIMGGSGLIGGCCWYAVTNCLHNLGLDITSLRPING